MAALKHMAGHPRLYRRNATYYHRAAIPKDIADTYPKAEETFTLGTKDHREAVQKVRVAAAEVDARFEAHRRQLAVQTGPVVPSLSPDQIQAIRDTYFHHRLEEDDETRLAGFKGEVARDESLQFETTLEGFNEKVSKALTDTRNSFDEYEASESWLLSETRKRYARGGQDTFFRSEAEEVLSWDSIGIRLAVGSESWPALIRAIQEADILASETIQERNQGRVIKTPDSPLSAPLIAPVGMLLSELFAERRKEAERTQEWSAKLVDDYAGWTDMFVEVAGNRPIAEYTKRDARAFKDTLIKLPSNRQKIAETKGKSTRECTEIAAKLGLKCLSVATINKAIGRLQATWNWANAQLDEDVADIFGPMKLKSTTSARDERDPFSPEQLNLIFTGPVFTGCNSRRNRSTAGDTNMADTSWYWLPLLGLFTGARLNELCQLRVSDLLQEDGVQFINIVEGTEDQRVKGHRKRVVPLHPTLVELGFWDYVKAKRSEKEERLFPALKLDANGYYSEQSSKDFSAYIKQIDAKTAKTSFHSFRHNFKDACRNGGVPMDIADTLQGHSLGGMQARYGSGKIDLQRLADEIGKVVYPNLNLELINTYPS